jgi:hypothetical protein
MLSRVVARKWGPWWGPEGERGLSSRSRSSVALVELVASCSAIAQLSPHAFAGDLAADDAIERFQTLGEMDLRIVATGSIHSEAIGSTRDGRYSLYLALAILEDCKLVTADERFANALRVTAHGSQVGWIGSDGR